MTIVTERPAHPARRVVGGVVSAVTGAIGAAFLVGFLVGASVLVDADTGAEFAVPLTLVALVGAIGLTTIAVLGAAAIAPRARRRRWAGAAAVLIIGSGLVVATGLGLSALWD